MEPVLRSTTIRPALLGASLILAACIGAARADPVPQNVLDNSYQSCMQGCVSGSHPQDKCTAYCNCSVDSIEEKFTAQEFSAVNTTTVNGKSVMEQPIQQGSKDKLVAIVNACGPKLK
jgi:hypothetical protein